jgi:hypothetical protein
MGKSTKIGNVHAGNKNANSKSGLGSFLTNKDFNFPVDDSNQNYSQNFFEDKVKNSIDPFYVNTGIQNKKPEIISLANFVPLDFDNNNLRGPFYEILEAKQDSLLINFSKYLEEINSPSLGQTGGTSQLASVNLNFIKTGSLQFSNYISDFLTQIEKIRSRFNPTYRLDETVIEKFRIGNPDSFGYPMSVAEVLFTNQENILNWTPTKTWIQMCLELKEVLKGGLPYSFKSETSDIFFNNNPDFLNNYKDPYLITDPLLKSTKRFNFNTVQKQILPVFSDDFVIDENNMDLLLTQANNLFVNGSLFNEPVFSSEEDLETSISKLSNLLCQELTFSNNLRQDVLDIYGYPSNKENFSDIWDYLIGQAGKDITDIDSDPLGNKNSLISLSQVVENDNTEVLTFEEKFLKDDIFSEYSSSDRLATITPGFYYYVESSLRYSNFSFDTSRLSKIQTRLANNIKMLTMAAQDMSFDQYPRAYRSIGEKVLNLSKYKNGQNSGYDIDTFNAFLSPIRLIRKIENEVLSPSHLLKRNENYEEGYITSEPVGAFKDFSAVLISKSISDPKLRSLLFLYVTLRINGSKFSESVVNSVTLNNQTTFFTFQELIAEKIYTRLSSTITQLKDDEINKNLSKNSGLYGTDNSKLHSLKDIREYFKTSGGNLPILDHIARMMISMLAVTKFKKKSERIITNKYNSPFKNEPETTSDDYITQYSGIQRTAFMAGLFELCCLIVHSANPERITAYVKSFFDKGLVGAEEQNEYVLDNDTSLDGIYGTVSFDGYVVVKKVYDAAIGKFNSLGKLTNTEANFKDLLKFGFIPSEDLQTITPSEYQQISGIRGLKIDSVMVNSEIKLYNYANLYRKYINRFAVYVAGLKKQIDEFYQILTNTQNSIFHLLGAVLETKISQGGPQVQRNLITKEQLLLTQNKLLDLHERAKSALNASLGTDRSVLKDTFYFSSFKESNTFEGYLPVEDTSLISWKFFIKRWFNSGLQWSEQISFNKKIMSVGIPQNLVRYLSTNVSQYNPNNSRKLSSIIIINLFRIDNFLSTLIHKPISYVFDLDRFPTKILKNYDTVPHNIKDVLMSENPPYLNRQAFPFYQVDYSNGKVSLKLFKNGTLEPEYQQNILQDYSFLPSNVIDQINNNHIDSFIAEEYLKYLTDVDFNENIYDNFTAIPTPGANFIAQTPSLPQLFNPQSQNKNSPVSTKKLIANSTFLTVNPSALINDTLKIRKFDRVFHVLFDPDDFFVDEYATDPETLEFAIQNQLVDRLDSNGNVTYKRRQNSTSAITYDQYFVTIEGYGN